MKTNPLHQAELFMLLAFIFFLVATQVDLDKDEQPKTPPIITLSELEEASWFDTGSAKISEDFFQQLLFKIVPIIDSLSREYDCNALAIIGHTSGMPVSYKRPPNLDRNLELFTPNINSDTQENIIAGSNIDLGIMRALAVTNYMKYFRDTLLPWVKGIYSAEFQQDYSTYRDTLEKEFEIDLPNSDSFPDLNKIQYFFPYSSGPLILEDGTLIKSQMIAEDRKQDLASRRRIEIRLFQYNPPDPTHTFLPPQVVELPDTNKRIKSNEQVIRDFLKAEDTGDFNEIYSFYSPKIDLYWSVKSPTKYQLKSQYDRSWIGLSRKQNSVLNISSKESNIYIVKTNFKAWDKSGELTTNEVNNVAFHLNREGKIIKTYGL